MRGIFEVNLAALKHLDRLFQLDGVLDRIGRPAGDARHRHRVDRRPEHVHPPRYANPPAGEQPGRVVDPPVTVYQQRQTPAPPRSAPISPNTRPGSGPSSIANAAA